MKLCALILIVCLSLITLGCAVGAKPQAAVQQQAATGSSASCTLALIYTCDNAVVGQSYICTPTVTQVAPYPCDNPPATAQAFIQANARSGRLATAVPR
jgi:hypothetical protein